MNDENGASGHAPVARLRGLEELLADRWRWIVPTCLAAAISGWLVSLEKSFWYDEAFSVILADRSLGEIVEQARTTDAVTEVGYLLLLHGWSDGLGFGYTETAVRGLSAACAVTAVPILYAIARRLYDPQVATVAALLMSMSPFFADYAAEGRQYGLLLLASSTLVYCYLRYEAGTAWWAIGYAAAGAVAMGAHWFGALVLLSLSLTASISYRSGGMRGARVAGVGAAALGAVLPTLLLVYARQDQRVALHAVEWIPRPTWRSMRDTVGSLLGSDGSLLTVPALTLAGRGLWIRPRSVVSWWLLMPFSIALGASYIRPMLVPRYLIISLPAAGMAVAAGAFTLHRRARAGALTTLLCLSAVGIANLSAQPPRENWASVIDLVSTTDAPVVLGWSAAVAPFSYSVAQHHPTLAARTIIGAYDGGAPDVTSRVHAHQRVWLVEITTPMYAKETAASRAALEEEYTATTRRIHDGRDTVIITTLYDRTSGGPDADMLTRRRAARASGP